MHYNSFPGHFVLLHFFIGQLRICSIEFQVLFAAGLGLFAYAGIAGGEVWKEFYQYFRESKFVS